LVARFSGTGYTKGYQGSIKTNDNWYI
jgi:hypothetical protein